MITEYQPRPLSAINIIGPSYSCSCFAHPSPFALIFHLMKRYTSVFSAAEAFILDRPLRRLVAGAGRESIAIPSGSSWSSPESDSRTDSPRGDKAVLVGECNYPV